MEVSWFDDPYRESTIITEGRSRLRQLQAMRTQVTPAMAANAAQIVELYPNLERDTIAAGALGGIPAQNPMWAQVAQRTALADEDAYQFAYGADEDRGFNPLEAIGGAIGESFGGLATAFKGTTRTLGVIAQSAYEELISRPLRTGVGLATGQTGTGGIGGAHTLAGSSTGIRALQQAGGGNALGGAINLLLPGTQQGEERVNLGSGFLAGSDVATPQDPNVQALTQAGTDPAFAQVQVQSQYGAPITEIARQEAERIKFRGMPVSPGRVAAGVFVLEPGSAPYNVLSGLIDAGAQIIADPTSKALVGFRIPGILGRLGMASAGQQVGGISNIRKALKADFGILEGGLRNSVFKPAASGAMKANPGRALLAAVMEFKDDPIALGRVFTNKGKATPPAALIAAIKGASDETEVANLLISNLGLTDAIPRVPVAGQGIIAGAIRGATDDAFTGSASRFLGRQVGRYGEATGRPITPQLGDVLGFKAAVGQTIEGTRLGRLFSTMPGTQLSTTDLDGGWQTLDDFMVNAKFSYDERNEMLTRWAGVQSNDAGDSLYELMKDVFSGLGDHIVRDVIRPSVAEGGKKVVAAAKAGATVNLKKQNQLTQAITNHINGWFDDLDEMRKYATANNVNMPVVGGKYEVLANGTVMEMPSANLLSEYLQNGVHLPDPREIRRAVSRVSRIVANDAMDLKLLPQMMDNWMQKVWKPMVLLRVAFPVRVQMDNQFRMAGAGLDSVFRHPMDWLAWMMADPTVTQQGIGKWTRQFGEVIGPTVRGIQRTLGIEDTFAARGATGVKERSEGVFEVISAGRKAKAAMTHGPGGLTGPMTTNAGELRWIHVRKGDVNHLPAWATEIDQLAADPVGAVVAQVGREDATRWFLENTELRRLLADTDTKRVLIDDAAAQAAGYRNADEAAEIYVRGVEARIHEKTGGRINFGRGDGPQGPGTGAPWYEIIDQGDTDLIAAIADRQYHLADGSVWELGVGGSSKRFNAYIQDLQANFGHRAPDVVKGYEPDEALNHGRGLWDKTVHRMFDALASRPENSLSRSPAFRQLYWERMEELVQFMDDPIRIKVKAAAEAANLSNAQKARIAQASRGTRSTRGVLESLEEADDIAKTFALDGTRNLLYDFNKRHNASDIVRNIFPFGEAWVEIVGTWFRLVGEHPEVLRRFQQTVEGARGSGFVDTDPVTGEDVFSYPGGGMIAEWMFNLAGVDKPENVELELQGQLQGMNVATASLMPGFGPLLQVPMKFMLPDEPHWDWVRDQVFPFGEPKFNSPGDIIELGLPAYAKKLLTPIADADPEYSRLFANTVVDVQRSLLMSGEYSNQTPGSWNRLQHDAKEIAHNITMMRGFLQFGLPTGPAVRFYGQGADPEGQFYLFQTLASEYRSLLEDNNFDDVAAFDQYVNKVGLDPTIFITSKTQQVRRRGATAPAFDFERTHEKLFEEYTNTAYYAQPDDPDAPFELRAWTSQLESGNRKPLNDEQWISARNHTLGAIQYEKERRRVADLNRRKGKENPENPTSEQSKYLRDYRIWLMEENPGYNRVNVGVPQRPELDQMIAEFQTWNLSPELMATDAGQGLELYLAARQQVSDLMTERELTTSPTGFRRSVAGRPYRAFLRQTADWIIAQHPDFGPIWQAVFQNELLEDEEPLGA